MVCFTHIAPYSACRKIRTRNLRITMTCGQMSSAPISISQFTPWGSAGRLSELWSTEKFNEPIYTSHGPFPKDRSRSYHICPYSLPAVQIYYYDIKACQRWSS